MDKRKIGNKGFIGFALMIIIPLIIGIVIGALLFSEKHSGYCPPSNEDDCSWYENQITSLEQSFQNMLNKKDCYRNGWINERKAAFNILKDGCYTYEQCSAKISALWSIFGGTSSLMQACGG